MDGSPSSIVMLGLGNGTFNGSPSLIVTGGYGIAAPVVSTAPAIRIVGRRTRITVTGRRTEITVTGRRTGEV